MLKWLIIKLIKYELKKLRKKDKTSPYIFIRGTGKDYPEYLMFTDDEQIRNKMHAIY